MTTIDIAFAKEWPTYEPIVRQATNENMRVVMEALFAKAFLAGYDHCASTIKGCAAPKQIPESTT